MKIWNPRSFKFEEKATPKRYQKSEFHTLKDRTNTPTILPYKSPLPQVEISLPFLNPIPH